MGLFDSFNPLIKIAKQVVKGVQAGIMQQVNIVDTAVKTPVNAMIGQVVGGEASTSAELSRPAVRLDSYPYRQPDEQRVRYVIEIHKTTAM